MKKYLLLILASLTILTAHSQQELNPFLKPDVVPPKIFIGFSTGINNMIGILGPQIEIYVADKLFLGGGIGLSTWGTKFAVNLQYYPKGWNKFYIKGGYSRNSGLENFQPEMELVSGETEFVAMDLKPVGNLLFTAGYAWKIGKRSKFYIEGGYALPVAADDYYELYDDSVQLSETSEKVLRIMRPGGLIIALGLNFGIGPK